MCCLLTCFHGHWRQVPHPRDFSLWHLLTHTQPCSLPSSGSAWITSQHGLPDNLRPDEMTYRGGRAWCLEDEHMLHISSPRASSKSELSKSWNGFDHGEVAAYFIYVHMSRCDCLKHFLSLLSCPWHALYVGFRCPKSRMTCVHMYCEMVSTINLVNVTTHGRCFKKRIPKAGSGGS